MKVAFLKYNFMFDPVNTWQRFSQFESDLGKFFREHGFEAEIINIIGEPLGERIVYIKPTVPITGQKVLVFEKKKKSTKQNLRDIKQKMQSAKQRLDFKKKKMKMFSKVKVGK